MIAIDNLVQDYGSLRALDNVSLRVEKGGSVAVTGPSGSGKTTLVHLIAGLAQPSAGTIVIGGREITGLSAAQRAAFRRENIGIVFQQFNLIPYLSALENVMLAQYLHSLPDKHEALAALERVGLRDRAHHRPAQLSGGEQQRVAIARAIINEPSLLLADEPTGNLDTGNETKVVEIFRQLQAEGMTIVIVTHNPVVAACCDRSISLQHGRIVGDTVKHLYLSACR